GAAVFSIFGKRGAELMPMLTRGSAGIEKFKQRAAAMGGIVTAADAENVRQASLATKQLTAWMNAAKQSIAIELSPVVIALAEQFQDVGVNAQSVGKWALTGGKIIAYSAAFAIDAWTNLGAVWDLIKMSFQALVAKTIQGIAKIVEVGGKLPEALGGDEFRRLAKGLQAEYRDLWNDAIVQRDAFLSPPPSAMQKVQAFFEGVANKVDETKKRIAAAPKDNSAAFTRLFELFERGQKVTQEMQSPLEKFAGRLRELDELLNAGAINWTTYERAVSQAGAALGQVQAEQNKLAGSAQFGSQEAYATIAKAQMGGGATSGLDNLKDAIKKQVEIQKRQQKDLDEIARAARAGFLAVGKI
ncbi:MAG TPA: hypothetical protein VH575_13770, partial [Gemmataceae bacterium]